MEDEIRERRRLRVLVTIAVVAVVMLLAAVIPSPYSIERPGPVVNTLGEVAIEGETMPVIGITGAEVHPVTGELNLLTVSIVGSPDHPLGWLSLVPALLDSSQRIAPVSEFYPDGVSEQDRTEANTVLMDSSQMRAAAAAFRALDQPVSVELEVVGVSEGGPADGELRDGDLLVSAGDEPLTDFAELRAAISASGAGEPLRLGIERDGVAKRVSVTPEIPEEGGEPLLGVVVSSNYVLPAEVDINLSEIGGPSAGLVFSLAIYDKLTPEPLLNGLTVSGTGTIADTGEVGAIGGLAQKMWAAARADSDLFLMPLDNCADVPQQIPGDLTVAPVASLDEAITAVEAVSAGEQPEGLERCEAKPE
ncbi:MAG: PDZ domain-containing protein [Leucobacter sp.]